MRIFVSRNLTQTTICTDKVLLERILGNLLSNAIRYTSCGGVLVSLRKAHGSDNLWLEVWDTGLGIAQEDQARIFDPYFQISNRERDRSKGLGLGLAIVRHATELLGLEVALVSRSGHGSRFRLDMPVSLVQQDAMASMPATLSESLPRPNAILNNRRILVIDDDLMVLQAMQALLGEWKMDLRCDSGTDDRALLQRDPCWTPECIISDFRLPGPYNGIQLLDALLECYPDAVGILQTGELGKDVHALAEEAGYLVLSKPVSAHRLASTLSAVLERRSMERLA
jgi:CheY-like chemotaxis protein